MEKLKPQPPADSVMWNGHHPGDGGAIYTRECFTGNRIGSVGPFWSAKDPGAQTVDPAVVARQAVDRMRLSGPDIQSPRADGRYVVGMPMWLHVGQSPTTFGPNSASAAAGGVQVTATAKVVRIRWSMGDGSSVVCQGPGAVYRPSDGKRPSPDCGHVYRRTSAGQDDKRYTLTATSTWQVDWNGAGQQGQFTETRSAQVRVPVGELQALG
ncbi:ATP/GTP-binding protein [Streptomyces sp. NEAU-S7GS2]|uniref:ATP/GTP-binding protein n=1 Tax=Streptomyces sp. NEAU-S7GS2 TaxID=2202000 RepID=UPI001EF68979|nr:ATP/GTP-binding protein [Streptomyces sp. NEAU-S7GS2]